MLDVGADPLECNNGAFTAMALAIVHRHITILHLFLKRGIPIPVCASRHSRSDLLAEAASNGHVAVVQLILAQAQPSSSDIAYALTDAAEKDHLTVVDALVEALREKRRHGGSENDGWTKPLAKALCLAAAGGHTEVVKYFVQLGVSPKTTDYEWDSPSNAAATNGHLDVLRYLLAHGGNVYYVQEWTHNHFRKAIEKDQIAAVKLMLEYVDPEHFTSISDKEQSILLYAAVVCESEPLVERLLESGASGSFCVKINLDDGYYCPILCGSPELAARTGNENIVTCFTAERHGRGNWLQFSKQP
ncbi:hypothetical protein SI65_10117 [Aspergillus cristatus]|uniref:Uncharacterized protein n=1 Tax=Aspergillus cristatus TaxID=573508 RepID=A0A1E3B0N5_ASPCR|nr:hypothetical protein SI65_10117 [Aspergillus cristatus]